MACGVKTSHRSHRHKGSSAWTSNQFPSQLAGQNRQPAALWFCRDPKKGGSNMIFSGANPNLAFEGSTPNHAKNYKGGFTQLKSPTSLSRVLIGSIMFESLVGLVAWLVKEEHPTPNCGFPSGSPANQPQTGEAVYPRHRGAKGLSCGWTPAPQGSWPPRRAAPERAGSPVGFRKAKSV